MIPPNDYHKYLDAPHLISLQISFMIELISLIYTDIYTDICRIIFVEPVLMIYLYIVDNQTNIQHHTFRYVPTFTPTFTPTLVGSGKDYALF